MVEDENIFEDTLGETLENVVNLFDKNFQEDCCGEDLYERAEAFSDIIRATVSKMFSTELLPEDITSMHNDLKEYIDGSVPKIEKQIGEIFSKHFQDKMMSLDKLLHEVLPEIRPLSEKIPEKFRDGNFFLPIVQERLTIEFARMSINKIRQGAKRIIDLYVIALKVSPQESTAQFLSRISNCYVWGFDSECVIQCRSVIDTAFRDTIPDSVCDKYFSKKKPDDDFGLANRIKAAKNEKIIDSEISKLAFNIKNRGDKAVHYQPDITKDVLGTIVDTIKVLEFLFNSKSK